MKTSIIAKTKNNKHCAHSVALYIKSLNKAKKTRWTINKFNNNTVMKFAKEKMDNEKFKKNKTRDSNEQKLLLF